MEEIRNLFAEIENIRSQIKNSTGADLKISLQDIRTGEHYDIAGDKLGWAASMIKVPILISAFREIDCGRLSLEEELFIDHKFTLDPTSEISSRPQGMSASVDELINYMILASCNESTNMIGNRLEIAAINRAMDEIGCPNTKISHLLYRSAPIFYLGIDGTSSNTTTANEMNRLMTLIYLNQAASEKSCEYMRHVLENNPKVEYRNGNVNDTLRRFLPKEIIIGAKMGLLDEDIMETGVINGDYAITIMINKIPNNLLGKCSTLISLLSRKVFGAYYKND